MKNAIEVNNLNISYPNFSIQDVSFTVPSGSIVGFVGENGAGKTTTLKSILNVVTNYTGNITIFNQDAKYSAKMVHQDIGVVFDESSFHDWLCIDHISHILKNIYSNWDEPYFRQLLSKLGLANLTTKKNILKTFSRGMKMKLSLATALAHHPKLLLLDEATSGLDPIVRDEILDLFLDFIKDDEHSILFSSHITSDIEKTADYVVFIHNGKIIINEEKDILLSHYAIVKCTQDAIAKINPDSIVGTRKGDFSTEVLINNKMNFMPTEGMLLEKASIDDIMLYTVRRRTR